MLGLNASVLARLCLVKVAQAMAISFNHFDLIVRPLDKAASVAFMKIVSDFF